MSHRLGPTLLALLGLTLPSAAPPESADDLLRRGNAAAERGDFAAAVEWYTRAEDRTTDPGRVAFNKANALYQLGQYREAGRHYERCLDEAGERIAPALYNLGTCLLQQTGPGEAKRLRRAVECFERCLERVPAASPLRADARLNLELAKIRWLQARAAAPNEDGPDPPSDDPSGKNDTPPPTGRDPGEGTPSEASPGSRLTPVEGPGAEGPADPSGQPTRPRSGDGSEPVLPTDDSSPDPTEPEVREALRQNGERIERDRRAGRGRRPWSAPTEPPPSGEP